MDRINNTPVRIYAMEFSEAPDALYVGASEKPLELRKAQHTVAAFHGERKRPVFQAIRDTVERGGQVDIHELEVVRSGDNWEEAEQFHIGAFRALGFRMLNSTKGGLGGAARYGHKMTPANKAALAASHSRPEVKAKHSASMLAYWASRKKSS